MAQSVTDRSQGKNSIKKLEVGDDTEAMDKHCYWLASPGFLSCLIPSILRCLRIATGTMSWNYHTKENVPTGFPTGQSREVVTKFDVSHSWWP